MNWKSLEDSTEFAEALGLLASLIAAVIALRDAQKEESKAEDHADAPSNEELPLQVGDDKPVMKEGALNDPVHKFGVKLNVTAVVIGLCFVVIFQLAIILFIAYKLL